MGRLENLVFAGVVKTETMRPVTQFPVLGRKRANAPITNCSILIANPMGTNALLEHMNSSEEPLLYLRTAGVMRYVEKQ
jgi:hypothetical protein